MADYGLWQCPDSATGRELWQNFCNKVFYYGDQQFFFSLLQVYGFYFYYFMICNLAIIIPDYGAAGAEPCGRSLREGQISPCPGIPERQLGTKEAEP